MPGHRETFSASKPSSGIGELVMLNTWPRMTHGSWQLGKGLEPWAVHVVRGVPKTKNGKIMRRAIRARYVGAPVGDMSALDPATHSNPFPRRLERRLEKDLIGGCCNE